VICECFVEPVENLGSIRLDEAKEKGSMGKTFTECESCASIFAALTKCSLGRTSANPNQLKNTNTDKDPSNSDAK
jgi:hypothetical protein